MCYSTLALSSCAETPCCLSTRLPSLVYSTYDLIAGTSTA